MRARTILHPILWIPFLLLATPVVGETPLPEERGAAGLWQALLKLRTTASALHITAHPDDEDGPMLTLLSRGQGVHTMLLTLNRGEGGADLIAPFFFDALGVLRSLELEQSDRYYGVEQFHTRVVDYGFSKTLDEALAKWGGEENVLRDVVRVVRHERPDVIIPRFRGDHRDGHGNHQTAGLMAKLVFEVAGDPNRFPEQTAEGLRSWQPKKLYRPASRSPFRAAAEPPEPWTVEVHSGDYDPFLGRSYFQIARHGLSFQRSQGQSGRPAAAGPFETRYQLVRTTLPGYHPERENSFFDGLDTTINGIAAHAGADPPAWLVTGLKVLSDAVEAAFAQFDPRALEKTLQPLTQGLKATRALLTDVEKSNLSDPGRDHILFLLRRKEKQFQEALAKALALDLEAAVMPDELPTGSFAEFLAVSPFNHAIPGQTFAASVRLVNRSRVQITPTTVELRAPQGWKITPELVDLKPLGYNSVLSARFRIQVAEIAELTRPYWHRDSIEEAVYKIDSLAYHTLPFPPPPAWGVLKLEVLDTPIEVTEALRVTLRDPLYGAIQPLLSVVPAIALRFAGEHGVIPLGQTHYKMSVVVHSNVKGPAQGTVRLQLPMGWRSTPESVTFSFGKEDEEATYDFLLRIPAGLREGTYKLQAVATYNGREYTEGYVTVTARDLGRFNLYRPAQHLVRGANVKLAENLRLGYVMGSGEEIPQSLELLGVRPDILGPADLATADLSRYDAIILGVRAYAVRPDVKTYNGRLLDYVKQGGVLIVQYQTPEYDNNYGPYPYSMTNRPEEVSEEDSPITILEPHNPIFNYPNKITLKDFEGWVEERGSKFLKAWDSRYTPLLDTHDKNQEPQKGGMVYARYGKGVYIYTAYAWYRQLPYGVPGAFRIYANMISLRKALTARAEPVGQPVSR